MTMATTEAKAKTRKKTKTKAKTRKKTKTKANIRKNTKTKTKTSAVSVQNIGLTPVFSDFPIHFSSGSGAGAPNTTDNTAEGGFDFLL